MNIDFFMPQIMMSTNNKKLDAILCKVDPHKLYFMKNFMLTGYYINSKDLRMEVESMAGHVEHLNIIIFQTIYQIFQ